ncbi:MAG: cupredoxin domain-containing protein [Patescibacteria group bacterium]
MNKKIVFVIVIAVALGGGFWFAINNSQEFNTVDLSDKGTINPPPETQIPGAETPVKEFIILGQNYSFSPNVITVNKGDKVKITLKNSEGFHDFKIDEFGAATKRINGGEEDSVEFVADKVGNFEFYCSVGGHRTMGMKGTLIVKE